MHAKRIGEYLELDDGTSRLVPQVALLLNIRQRLSEELPDTLWRSCAIANYKQGVVVIFAGNNAAAAKLRLWAAQDYRDLGRARLPSYQHQKSRYKRWVRPRRSPP